MQIEFAIPPPADNFRFFASSLQNSRILHIFSVHPTSAYQCLLIHWDFSLKGSVPNLPFPKHKTHYTSNLNLNTDFHGFTGLKRFWNLTILIFVNPRAFLRISFKTSRTLRTLREIISQSQNQPDERHDKKIHAKSAKFAKF